MNSDDDVDRRDEQPAGVAAQVEDVALGALRVEVLDRVGDVLPDSSLKVISRTYPTSPYIFVMVFGTAIRSRVRVTSNGFAVPRVISSVTFVPSGPRTSLHEVLEVPLRLAHAADSREHVAGLDARLARGRLGEDRGGDRLAVLVDAEAHADPEELAALVLLEVLVLLRVVVGRIRVVQ